MPQQDFQGMNMQTSMGTGYNPAYQSSPTAPHGSPYQQGASGCNPSAGYGGYGEGYGCSGGCGSPYGQYSDPQALSNYGMAPQAGYAGNPQGYAGVPQSGYAGAPQQSGYNAGAAGYSGDSYAGADFPGGQAGSMGTQDRYMTQQGQGQYGGAMPAGYANNVLPGYGMQQGAVQDPGMMQGMNQGMQKGKFGKTKAKGKKGGKRACC